MGKILIVEDEQIIAYSLKRMIEKMGHESPVIVSYGVEVVEAMRAVKADLIVMDIVLKGDVDGIEAARQVLNEYYVPIIFITGNSDRATRQRAMQVEHYGYLEKPIVMAQLRGAISDALTGFEVRKGLTV